MFIQVHHLQGFVDHGHTARRPLVHILTLNVEVEQDSVVVGIGQGESTRAVAVVDVGGVWTDKTSFKGHSEAPQPAYVGAHWVVGASSGSPQSSLHLIRTGHRLQGLQQKKCTVLALSCSVQQRKQKHQLKSGETQVT